MAKNKIGKLFDKTIVWGCSLNELDEQELLYIKNGNNIILKDNNGTEVTEHPSGIKRITDTKETDVSKYAIAYVEDINLTPSNIKSGVIILGVTGEYEAVPTENLSGNIPGGSSGGSSGDNSGDPSEEPSGKG